MNKIILAGKVYTEPEFSHETKGKKFYKFYLESVRDSGNVDILPCIVPEENLGEIELDKTIKFGGNVRTRNEKMENGTRLIISAWVKDIMPYDGEDENKMLLEGYICKEATYRYTPFVRKISDTIIASHRSECRNTVSDYIPSIYWGNDALKLSNLSMGTLIRSNGRLQSREYNKKYPGGLVERKVAYEFSAMDLIVCESEV